MRLQLFIALRYLFSKKSHNIINIISMICAGGICVATMALVCTLSVYNGFQQLISGVISSFDPDLKISLVEGKTFSPQDCHINELKDLPFVQVLSEVLEENALIKNKEKQTSVVIKGVDNNYTRLIPADSIMEVGPFSLKDEQGIYTILGVALSNQINANLTMMSPVTFYAPKYNTKVNLSNPEKSFNVEYIYVGGLYATHQYEIDSKYAFLPIEYARGLFGYDDVCSSIELNINNTSTIDDAQRTIQSIVGDHYKVENKVEQHADFYRMMKIEKWITFLILFFILLIAVVNVIGSLTMLILEKKRDIKTLRNLGATQQFIQQVFLLEGWLISVIGAITGTILGVGLCLIQEWFGLIKLGNAETDGSFLVNAYPVYVQMSDILLILVSVLAIGLLIAWIPTRYLKRISEQ